MSHIPITVSQYDRNGKLIKTFPSYTSAGRSVNMGPAGIRSAAIGITKYSAGYIWRLYEVPQLSEEQMPTPKGYRLKKIYQYTREGAFIKEWPSLAEASKETGISSGTLSSAACDRRGTAGNCLWRSYKVPQIPADEIPPPRRTRRMPVSQYTQEGVLVKTHINAIEAGKALGVPYAHIARAARLETCLAGGFLWRRYEEKCLPEAELIRVKTKN